MRRVRDYAQVKGDGVINQLMAEQALDMLSVDEQGFDHLDRRFLLALIEKFEGGRLVLIASPPRYPKSAGRSKTSSSPILFSRD